MEVIPDEEEVAIDAVPLATKSPKIVDWKIYKEGKKSYYQIVRANRKSHMYMIFSQMLKSFDREDLDVAPRKNLGLLVALCIASNCVFTVTGLSLVSSPIYAMKSQSQIQSSAAVKFEGVTDWYQSHLVIEN
ncbi:hypothetical protein Tco_0705228 [Tanacetum coccineum]|uniref:Uncharacterized protein n=1 Tax=Tanacetum coccineum TaxID=301880 RepID=A0ABQ4Y618_9ASTR